jgi:hypothetical protein
MLRSISEIFGYVIQARDGEIGKVHDFYFDDETWHIRYLVIDTGKLLPGRKVLIVPSAIAEPDWRSHILPVELTKDKILKAPDIDVDKPVSRQHEFELHKHYGWAPYWIPFGAPGIGAVPPSPVEKEEEKEKESKPEDESDSHLRSAKEVIGYHIQALDGEIGHVEDFIVEDIVQIIRYMVVDTRNWLPGKKVLIAPLWIEKFSWKDSKVFVDMLREAIKESPEFNPSEPVNRRYEERLYDFYGRPKYWT